MPPPLEQISTTELLFRLWPMIVSIVLTIAALAVALYRLKVLYNIVLRKDGTLNFLTKTELREALKGAETRTSVMKDRLSKNEETYLKISEHEKLCTIAGLEIKNLLEVKLNETQKQIASTVSSQLEEHHKQTIGAIRGMLKKTGGSDQ